jgi:small subunit ribosomal protein S16
VGSKKNPVWRVVVADQRSPRDGRTIETVGHYNPQTQPSTVVLDRERLDYWIQKGAQPTNSVRKLMRAPNTPVAAGVEEAAAEPEAAPEPDPEAAPPSEGAGDAEAAPEPEVAADPEAPQADAGPEPAGDAEPAADAAGDTESA